MNYCFLNCLRRYSAVKEFSSSSCERRKEKLVGQTLEANAWSRMVVDRKTEVGVWFGTNNGYLCSTSPLIAISLFEIGTSSLSVCWKFALAVV